MGRASGEPSAPKHNAWLFKTEPSAYAFETLLGDGRTAWDGVSNAVALKHLRSVRRGDRILVYHTGDERAIVGLAHAVADAEVDSRDPRLATVTIAPDGALERPVPLAIIKADPRFAELALVRMGRLSVMPIPPDLFDALVALGGGTRSVTPGRPRRP